MSDVQEQIVEQLDLTGIDENHYTCCMDVHIALCGFDLSVSTYDPNCVVGCVVCVDLDNTEYCPRGWRCP